MRGCGCFGFDGVLTRVASALHAFHIILLPAVRMYVTAQGSESRRSLLIYPVILEELKRKGFRFKIKKWEEKELG